MDCRTKRAVEFMDKSQRLLTVTDDDIDWRSLECVWSAGRMKDGWTYGEERNDAEKKHPCLVPYEHLSEEEKEYDRNTSVETIKLILKLGFKITKDWLQ